MSQFSDLSIELVDQIIENLSRKDRLKILLRLSKSFSRHLKLSCWWRKELQISLGPIRPQYSDIDWQTLYQSFRLGWSAFPIEDKVYVNHRSLARGELEGIYDTDLVFFDGYF
jgi:hypothetical protein